MIYIHGTLDYISVLHCTATAISSSNTAVDIDHFLQKGCFVGGTGGHGTATADELVSLPPASQGWHTLKEEVGGFQRRS